MITSNRASNYEELVDYFNCHTKDYYATVVDLGQKTRSDSVRGAEFNKGIRIFRKGCTRPVASRVIGIVLLMKLGFIGFSYFPARQVYMAEFIKFEHHGNTIATTCDWSPSADHPQKKEKWLGRFSYYGKLAKVRYVDDQLVITTIRKSHDVELADAGL